MFAVIINTILVLGGSLLGLLLQNRITERFSSAIAHALGLCVLVIGITSAIGTQNILCLIVSMAVGTALGERLRIEDRLDRLGDMLRAWVMRGKNTESRFTEGFVTASLLFCIGSMAIMGSIEAGINHNYSIILAKSVIDGVTAVTFAAAMGVGVLFSALSILLYQGTLTLLAGAVGPYLSQMVITEMSAVGGAIIIGIAVNMLGLGKTRLRVGNMLPAIFLPLLYLPFAGWLSHIF